MNGKLQGQEDCGSGLGRRDESEGGVAQFVGAPRGETGTFAGGSGAVGDVAPGHPRRGRPPPARSMEGSGMGGEVAGSTHTDARNAGQAPQARPEAEGGEVR